MPENSIYYIWRCAKCTNHFANIHQMEGRVKMEKKCPKCKALNSLAYTNKEIFIHCKLIDPNTHEYRDEIEETMSYKF